MKARIFRIIPGDSPELVWEGEMVDSGGNQFTLPDHVELSPHINYGWEIGWELPPFRGQRPSVTFHVEDSHANQLLYLIQNIWDAMWSFVWFRIAVWLVIFFAIWALGYVLGDVFEELWRH